MEGVLIPKVKKGLPRIRFAGFNDDWGASKLEPLCQRIMVGIASAATHAYRAQGIPMFRNQNIKEEGLEDSDLIFIDETYEKIHRGKRLKGGDILTVRTGYPGLSCVVPDKYAEAQCFTSLIVRPKPEYLVSEWLAQYINSPVGKRKMFAFEAGGAQKNINSGSLENLVVPVISLPEQQKIAAFLGAVDRKIQQLKRKQALLERYKKAVVQQLFSQELRFKRKDGGEFPEWEEKRLGDVVTFTKGKGVSKGDIVEGGATKCIRYGELYTNYGEVIDEVVSSTNVDPSLLLLSKQNDVIIPASGETQLDIAKASCVMHDGIALGGDLNVMRTKENGVFLAYYLNGAKRNAIAEMAQGNAVVHLYAKQLQGISIDLPSLEEQSRIAGFLMALDAKVAGVAQAVAAAQKWKKGLLQQMFV